MFKTVTWNTGAAATRFRLKNRKEKMTKKWNEIPTKIWKIVLYKEDSKGNQKFYEYDGDHSWIADGLDGVEDEYLIEQKDEKN